MSRPGDPQEQIAERRVGEVVGRSEGELGSIGPSDPGLSGAGGGGTGRPLDPVLRQVYEPHFDRDLSSVRIHTDAEAGRAARALGAKAFTHGTDIYFGPRRFRPTTHEGRRLLVHELSHAVSPESGTIFRDIDHTVASGDTLLVLQRIYGVSVAAIQAANGMTGTTVRPGQVLIIPNRVTISYVVEAGDGLQMLARRFGVTVDAIARVNSLASTAQLSLGQSLDIPVPQTSVTHTVVSGDTLFTLSRRFGVQERDLRTANRLPSSRIRGGQTLTVPGLTSLSYTVEAGDTLFSLSQRFGTSVDAIQSQNGLATTTIRPGQSLTIPTPASGRQSSPPATPATPTPAPTPTPTPTPAPTPTPTPTPAPTPAPAPTPTATPSTSATGHTPGGDFASGQILERSFLRQSNRSSLLQHGGQNLFFEPGTTVTRLGTHGLWIQVRGPAHVNPSSPTLVTTPSAFTGWIQREWTDMTLGRFRDLPVRDASHFRTSSGSITHVGTDSAMPASNVQGIVMHQTGGNAASNTLNEYRRRARLPNNASGSSVASHYVIDRNGDIVLTGGLDRLIHHVGPHKATSVNPAITSAASIGIEHSGAPYHFRNIPTHTPNQTGFAADMAAVRTELRSIPLSPAFRARLLALSDRNLYHALRGSGHHGWDIYPDISGSQRRSSHLLTRNLQARFGLSTSDLFAHEDLRAKALGEGENILEFHLALARYPQLVLDLTTLASGNSALNRIVTHENRVLDAIRRDATAAENTAVAAGQPAARQREVLRQAFYNQFWGRMRQIEDMVTFLRAQGSNTSAGLTRRINGWQF